MGIHCRGRVGLRHSFPAPWFLATGPPGALYYWGTDRNTHHRFLEWTPISGRPGDLVGISSRVFICDAQSSSRRICVRNPLRAWRNASTSPTRPIPADPYIVPDMRVIRANPPDQRLAPVPRSHGRCCCGTDTGRRTGRSLQIREHRLEVLDRVHRSVVAVIELLSPTNKAPGARGRNSFLQKRRDVFASPAHWLEIDLLRAGTRTANFAETTDAEYQLYLSRAGDARKGYVLPIFLRDRLPSIGIPLRQNDPDALVDLQSAFDHVYELCGYDMDFDYTRDPAEPLSEDTARWARQLIASRS